MVRAFFGVLFLLQNENPSNLNAIAFNLSDILMLAANFLFALHHVWVKKYVVKMENMNLGLGEFTTYTLSFWFSVVGIGFFGHSHGLLFLE